MATSACFRICLRMLLFSLAFDGAGFKIVTKDCHNRRAGDLRHFLGGILKIPSDFSNSVQTLGKIDLCGLEASLSVSLQFFQFSLFGIELARSIVAVSFGNFDRVRYTYVCAWVTNE